MSDTFTACDSDGDGFLNEAEFLAWGASMNEKKAAKGLFCDDREGVGMQFYGICKANMPDAPGIDLASLIATISVMMKKTMELKNAAGQ